MRKLLLLLVVVATALPAARAQSPIVLEGTLPTQTLTAANRYLLRGFVKVASGSTLTIEPGTVIYGEKGTNGTLIVQPGGRIVADGTAARPIVFTSALPARQRNPGDWGGIILLGRASLNTPTGTSGIEGIPPTENVTYGGGATPNDADNSGVLRYVRIEFPGVALAPNNEINGLTFGAVGSGTVVEHVQVSYSGDDSFEWFGGTVNAKYLIAYRGLDDDFDTDFGFQGRVQFAVGYRDPARADAVGSGTGGDSNGFECDNDGTGTLANPRTYSVFSNVTLIGPRAEPATAYSNFFFRGARLRRACAQSVLNSVIAGWPTGLRVESVRSASAATNDSLQVRNVIVAGTTSATAYYAQSDAGTFNAATFFATPAFGNRTYATNAEVLPAAAFLSAQDPASPVRVYPNPVPALTSPAATGANFLSTRITAAGTFFTPTTYVGAFDPAGARWDAGWAGYNPETYDYTGTVTDVEGATAAATGLGDVYPNPARGAATVGYTLGSAGPARVALYDALGREVAVLADGVQAAGAHTASLGRADLPAGLYVVRLQTDAGAFARPLTLVK